MTFLISLSGCRGWTAADQADYDKHCPKGSCNINVTKESGTNPCSGPVVPIDCHKDNPNPGSSPSPKPKGDPGNNNNEQDDDDDLGELGGETTNTGDGTADQGNGNGDGGTLEGAGDVLNHWGSEISKGWKGLKGELNGSNAEKRRKKREAKRLLNEIQDLWKQADGYEAAVLEDKKGAEASWGLLNDSWKEFGIASREKDLEEFRGRYNGRTRGILDNVPVADPSVFDGLGKGRGDGIYPEHQKVANGRKYLKYARGKLNPNAADYGVRKTLVDFGDAALDESETSYRSGNVMEGNAWYEIGLAAADAALSLTPGIGLGKDMYEAFSGNSLLTGKKLTKFERSMAMVGVMTFGLGKFGTLAKLGGLVEVIGRGAKSADEAEAIAKIGKDAVEITESAAKAGVNDGRVFEDVADWVKGDLPCVALNTGSFTGFSISWLFESVAFASDCLPGQAAKKAKEIFESAGEIKKAYPEAKVPWASTKKSPDSAVNAAKHWNKHGHEFPEIKSAQEYTEKAVSFAKQPPTGTLSKSARNGTDSVLYHPDSNTLVIRSGDGVPASMYRPDPAVHGYPSNLDFFNRNPF
ncbi:MAG: pre-toxin TG domain-containing protein [Pseudobdellovibrionaceae bacterium]|nr:pre-toxin TG domain-containing protein [Pseudobdellovibrionaceae bacterium]